MDLSDVSKDDLIPAALLLSSVVIHPLEQTETERLRPGTGD